MDAALPTSTRSSLRWVRCASFSLVFTSGYWFCRNSSSRASSCSSVKMVRWRLVLLCTWPGGCSSFWASPSLHCSESTAGLQPYGQAADVRDLKPEFYQEDQLVQRASGPTVVNEIGVDDVCTVGAVAAAAKTSVTHRLSRASIRTHRPLFESKNPRSTCQFLP